MAATPYQVVPDNRFFQANRSLVEDELRLGHTVTLTSEVDLTEIKRVRAAAKERPSYTSFVVKAIGLALAECPFANRRIAWRPVGGAQVQAFERADVAVAIERQLPDAECVAFVDIVRDAKGQSLTQIHRTLYEFSRSDETNSAQWRAFCNVIRSLPTGLAKRVLGLPRVAPGLWAKYRGASVLISSPAKYGVDKVVACWAWPIGISFGYVEDRPVVKNGIVTVAPTFDLVCNFDRRLMTLAEAGRFVGRIVAHLEHAGEPSADVPAWS